MGEAAGSRSGALLRIGRYLYALAPRRTIGTLALMLFGGLSEGLSIVLLVPILRMLDPAAGAASVRLPHMLTRWLGSDMHVSLAATLGGFALLVSLRGWLMHHRELAALDLVLSAVNRLRQSLFAAITRARSEFLAGHRGSDLNHAMTADVERVQVAMTHILTLAQSVLLLLIYVTISLILSTRMTVFACVVGGLALALLQPMRAHARRHGASLTGRRQQQYQIVSEFLGSVKVAKSFNAEPVYIREMQDNLDSVRRDILRYLRAHSTGTLMFQVVSACGLAVFVYVALVRLQLPLAQLVVMLFLMMRIAPRFVALQGTIQEALVSSNAFDVLRGLEQSCLAAAEQPGEREAPPAAFDTIEIADVDFAYAGEPDRAVLSGVSLTIRAGATIAIVGPSGSGKSTLADLLMALIEPRRGAILIDGVPLSHYDRAGWRSVVGYVPQEVFLLHDTIRANVALAARDAGDDAIWDALDAAGAADFVRALPEGLATLVGDRGVRLSGGERQRIALARALLRRPLLLILDEATSALDWESRLAVTRSLERLHGRMTIMSIAHRPSAMLTADHVVAIRDGRVVESGALETLTARSGGYVHAMLAGEIDR